MRKNKLIIFWIMLSMIVIPSLNLVFTNNITNVDEKEEKVIESRVNNLHTSDVAGSDLYAEKINAFVAGNKSIIKQSLFTNDTNILSQFDSNDPAFYKSNLIISASNGMNPQVFPRILTESDLISQYHVGFNNFVGFLFYDEDLNNEDAQMRAERALEIIKRKFKIDLIMINVSESNFFPFIGTCPNWECYFDELMINFPMDGYWKALDRDRLSSQEYTQNYHISSSIMLLNSLDFFEGTYDISTDQVNFNLESLDLSFLGVLELQTLVAQFDTIIENYGDLFNATISEDELEQFVEIFSSFTLSNNSHYTSISIQYEGLDDGIQKVGSNQYEFNLWDAIGYEGNPLSPSKKIYIALTGAFMSNIEINILCTEVIDVTPINFKISDYLLEQIGLLFYFAGIDFDTQDLKNYSFDLFWVDEEGIKSSYVKPVNLQDPNDIINFMQLIGFQGLSYIPTGIINPINDLSITYEISNSEPNLLIKKELIGENASYGAFQNFSYYISAKNVGNVTVWGVPTQIPFELNDFFLLLTLGSQALADQLQDAIWEIVRIEYPNQYDSLEDFFNFNEDPRIFYFDSFGVGVFDTFFPDLLNISNLSPYNEDMDHIIDIIDSPGGYPQLIVALAALGVSKSDLEDYFTNSYSIWNDDNWKLNPGEILSYEINNYSIANLDSFTPFYMDNFTIQTIPTTPEIISGTSLSGTNPEMALATDDDNWIIGSEEKFLEQRVDIDFIFKNKTKIDFVNNKLERVSFIININASISLEPSDFEIFDFNIEEFINMTPYLENIINNTWTFSIINQNESLDWLFYPLDQQNYTVLFKIKLTNSESFNISIDDLDIEYSVRDINFNDDSGSRLVYGSSSGNIQFQRLSNSIPLCTYDGVSLVVNSQLNNFSSKPGEIVTYEIDFKNIGTEVAKNITISMLIPGIIDKINNFTLSDNNLSYYLAELAPAEEKTINFSFYVPNSISLRDISIIYYNPKNIEGGNSSKIVSFTNQIFVSAPINYQESFPFVRTIEINYNSDLINNAPAIGDIFNLTVILKNIGPQNISISDLNLKMVDQFGDLKRIDDFILYFEDIAFNDSIYFNITLKKKGWKGYYYPPINFIEGSESRTIQISTSAFKLLGVINFTIVKSVSKYQIEIGDKIIVSVEVENTGTISIEDIKVNDMISYSQADFSLTEGNLVNLINSLDPGEKITFNYTIRSKRQILVNLKPASIKFYYLHENEVFSNAITIKIITPKSMQFLFITLPILMVLTISSIYIWQTKKYKKKKKAYQRSEMHIFELSSRETILKIDRTLRERLNIILKNSKNQIINPNEIQDINKIIKDNEEREI
ncbi:MAG: hypothetical protein ACFE9C_02285 [Candidatus Hodarchaeota archaeon]